MNTAAAQSSTSQPERPHGASQQQNLRENVESIVVAFILAFLFRAFVAEAFVIPTGSMAPTLMGAHKDIVCEICGKQYQATASQEFDSNSGQQTIAVTVASTCSICRGINAYDLRNDPNHKTFSGDRILVSKFDYVFSKPERWDVFVFKYPTEARMNYIKRLVGLPGEQLLIRGGDVFVQPEGSNEWTIARKPPEKIKAMRQIVADTKFQAPILVEQGWPSAWQPWSQNNKVEGWTLEHTPEKWSAKLSKSPQNQWLRYYHKAPDKELWERVLAGDPLPEVEPQQSKLITDYLAYNSSYQTRRDLLTNQFGQLAEGIDSDTRALDWLRIRNLDSRISSGGENDGYHWVGDLISEFEVEIESDSGLVLLDLVEFGIHFQCKIDVATGNATLSAMEDGGALPMFDGSESVQGKTKVRGPGTYRLEMANVDDQIVIWVNGSVVQFEQPTEFDSYEFRSELDRRPFYLSDDPLDAAPLGIGGQNISLTVNRALVHRDIYYIAIQDSSYSDFSMSNGGVIRSTVPDPQIRNQLRTSESAILAVYAHPEWWKDTDLFQLRGERKFQLDAAQYFPMGDNSAASSDARAWFGHHYVEEKFLLGKALLVFWPHTWNTPVPFTPNFSRMGLIR